MSGNGITDSYSDSNSGHRYYYNSTTGNLTREINALGVETNYTYFQNTSKVSKEEFDQYEYTYYLNGNPDEIKVANNRYAKYNYNDGKLTSIDYGNGQSIIYDYSDFSTYHNVVQKFKENSNSTPVNQFLFHYDNNDENIEYKIDYSAHQKTVYRENNLVEVYAPENAQENEDNLVYSYYDREEKTETVTDPNTQEETEVTTPATSGRTFGSTSLVTTFSDNTANITLNNANYMTVETVEMNYRKKKAKKLKMQAITAF